MTCASCGYENPSDARFCAGCGRPVEEQGAALGEVPGEIRKAPIQLAGGRYRIKGYLGEGGRKVVYLAQDTALGREVAIAMLKTDDLDRGGKHQLEREAQAMARLGDHPNIVSVFDIGEEDGDPYIVSQYMAGGSRRRWTSACPWTRPSRSRSACPPPSSTRTGAAWCTAT